MYSRRVSVFILYFLLSIVTLGLSYWLQGRMLMFGFFVFWLFFFYFLFFRTRAYEKAILKLNGQLLRGSDPFRLGAVLEDVIIPYRLEPLPILLLKNEKAPVSFLIRRWGKRTYLAISETLLNKFDRENPIEFQKGLLLFYHFFENREQSLLFESLAVLAEALLEFSDALDELIQWPLSFFSKQKRPSPWAHLTKPLFTSIWKIALRSVQWQRIDAEVSKAIGTQVYSRLIQLCYYFEDAFPDRQDQQHLFITIQNPNLRPAKTPRLKLKQRYANFHGSEPSH